MSIMLTKEHEDWLRAKVAAGEFASLDEAVKSAVQRLIIDDERDDDDDLMWAKPLAAEGLAQLERGECLSHEEVFTSLQRLIDAA
jgi:Arc/MetJ-type ribon-helix-helix transcriptional regulator